MIAVACVFHELWGKMLSGFCGKNDSIQKVELWGFENKFVHFHICCSPMCIYQRGGIILALLRINSELWPFEVAWSRVKKGHSPVCNFLHIDRSKVMVGWIGL